MAAARSGCNPGWRPCPVSRCSKLGDEVDQGAPGVVGDDGVFSHQSLVTSCQLPVAGCRLPVAGCRLPVASCQLPVAQGTSRRGVTRLENTESGPSCSGERPAGSVIALVRLSHQGGVIMSTRSRIQVMFVGDCRGGVAWAGHRPGLGRWRHRLHQLPRRPRRDLHDECRWHRPDASHIQLVE